MDRVAVFVDAGYLFAQGSSLLTGQKHPRGDLTLDYEAVAASLREFATRVAGVPLLRIYWYDGSSSGPTTQHLALAYTADVKIRLGFVNRAGEQKGVDSLAIGDMIDLARNRAMSDAVLLSGDEDLRVGVQQCQSAGIRVHLLGIEPSRGSQATLLLQEADTTHEWDAEAVGAFLSYTPRAPHEPAAAEEEEGVEPDLDAYENIAAELASTVDDEVLETVVVGYRASSQIPREYDARLLATAGRVLGIQLDAGQKRTLRECFIAECENRMIRLTNGI